MLLSVIIVNYNVKYFLEQCLCALQAALTGISAEVLIVDNCSSDDSIAYLQPYFSHFIFIQNDTNEGFAKANNKALALSKGEYVLFLNPDTIIAEDTLQQCIHFFTQHEEAGATGVRMIDGSGNFLQESKRSFPSPLVSLYKLTGLAALFPKSKIFNRYALGFLPEQAVYEVDVLAGAFMMVKRKVLEKTGGFDEQFFMYAEDIDLSYRIQKAGYRNYYLGNITIVHFKGESTAKGNIQYVRMFYQAMRLFVKKHYGGAGAWMMNKSLYAGILLRQAMAAITLPFYAKTFLRNKQFKKVLFIGSQVQTIKAENIISKRYPALSFHHIKEQKELIKNIEDCIVILCIGSLSYTKAIALSQQYKKTGLIVWFGNNSRSIAGSNNKDRNGYVFV